MGVGNFCFHQQWTPGLTWYVVGWSATDTFVTAFNHKQVAVLDACVELHSVCTQLILKIADQHVCLFCAQMTGRVILDVVAFYADEVAADGEVTVFQSHTDARCLKWTAAFIYFFLVVA